MSFGRLVEHHADRFGSHPAVAYGETTVSYGELDQRARHAAGALRASGVRKGDVLAVLLHNSLGFVDTMLGAAYLGAIFMPLNWRLSPAEIAYVVNHSGAVAIVSEPELDHSVGPSADHPGVTAYLHAEGDGADRWQPLAALMAASREEPCARAEPSDVLRLMYTSGTTARPKGVMITHGNVEAKCAAHAVELDLSRADRGLVAGPLYHVGALDLTFTTILYVGAFARILRRFEAASVIDAIESERITTLWLAPAMVNLVLADHTLEGRDLSSVRVLIDGGEKMPLPLIERILNTFPNGWFADAYGLTETVSGDTFLNKGAERTKLGSVGKPVLNAEVRIVDESDEPVANGVAGEIVLRGPKVCAGYWRDPEATAHAMRGGWFHTGDVGLIDEDGYLFIVDRLKDVVISGGENIASLEVERVLYEHTSVVEVAVVGRPDPTWGEVPVAYVVLRSESPANEETLRSFCRERLASFKVPKHIRLVDALPRNPSGKVLKRELRARESVEL